MGAPAMMPSGEYLVNIAEEHASARGCKFDEPGRGEFRTIADRGIETANKAGIFTVEDILRDVAPNTIRLTDVIITYSERAVLTARAVRQGFLKICPLFPFC
jgi:hypothetical protein